MGALSRARRAGRCAYLRWLQEQRFEHPAHQIALQELVDAVRISKDRVDRIEAAIEQFLPTWSLAPVVRAYRHCVGWISSSPLHSQLRSGMCVASIALVS